MQTIQSKILDRGSEFLRHPDVVARLSDQLQADIKSGKKEFYLADFFFRKKLSGGTGIIDLVKESDKRITGVTTLDGGKLPKDIIMALVAIGVAYGYTSATTDDAASVRYSNSEYLATFPTGLVNSEISFRNGDKILVQSRMKKFLANAFAEIGSEANQENEVILPQPKLIMDGKVLKVEISYPEGSAALPSGSHFIEIRWTGAFIGDRT